MHDLIMCHKHPTIFLRRGEQCPCCRLEMKKGKKDFTMEDMLDDFFEKCDKKK